MGSLAIREAEGGVVFAVKVVPGSSRTAVAGLLNGMLKIRVTAPAEKGKANKCLLRFISSQLGVRNSAVNIVTGQTSSVKEIRVLGISKLVLTEKLKLNK